MKSAIPFGPVIRKFRANQRSIILRLPFSQCNCDGNKKVVQLTITMSFFVSDNGTTCLQDQKDDQKCFEKKNNKTISKSVNHKLFPITIYESPITDSHECHEGLILIHLRIL